MTSSLKKRHLDTQALSAPSGTVRSSLTGESCEGEVHRILEAFQLLNPPQLTSQTRGSSQLSLKRQAVRLPGSTTPPGREPRTFKGETVKPRRKEHRHGHLGDSPQQSTGADHLQRRPPVDCPPKPPPQDTHTRASIISMLVPCSYIETDDEMSPDISGNF